MIPYLYVCYKTSSAQAVGDSVNVLVHKFRVVNFTKEFGRELDPVKIIPELGSSSFRFGMVLIGCNAVNVFLKDAGEGSDLGVGSKNTAFS